MSHFRADRRITSDPMAVDDADTPILHVDIDAFFAAVELRRHPELAGRPMMVAGTGGRGVVLSATYEARAYGVRSAMPVARARALCPRIAVVPPDQPAYRRASQAVMEILGRFTPLVEQVSVDEAFLDVAGARRTHGGPARIAVEVRRQVASELALTATVGVAGNKFLAKLASSLAKPDGVLVVPASGVSALLRPLSVRALWGVGPQTAERLIGVGLETVGDVADIDPARLARIVGVARAAALQQLAHGRDDRPVTPGAAEVSIGSEETFATDQRDPATIDRMLLELAAVSARRLRQRGRTCRTVVLKVRFADFTTVTRSETLATATDQERTIVAAARRNWQRLGDDRAVRLVGVRLESLGDSSTSARQLTLDLDPGDTGWVTAQHAVDNIAARFGDDAVRPASLLASDGPPGARREHPQQPWSPPARDR